MNGSGECYAAHTSHKPHAKHIPHASAPDEGGAVNMLAPLGGAQTTKTDRTRLTESDIQLT